MASTSPWLLSLYLGWWICALAAAAPTLAGELTRLPRRFQWELLGITLVSALVRFLLPARPVFRRTVTYEIMRSFRDAGTCLAANRDLGDIYGNAISLFYHWLSLGGMLFGEHGLMRLGTTLGVLSVALLYLALRGMFATGVLPLAACSVIALNPVHIRVCASESMSPVILFFLWLGIWSRVAAVRRETPSIRLEFLSFATVLFGLHLRYLTVIMPLQVYAVGVFLGRGPVSRRLIRALPPVAIIYALSWQHFQILFGAKVVENVAEVPPHMRLMAWLMDSLHSVYQPGPFEALLLFGLGWAILSREPAQWLLAWLWLCDLPLTTRMPKISDQLRYYTRVFPIMDTLAVLAFLSMWAAMSGIATHRERVRTAMVPAAVLGASLFFPPEFWTSGYTQWVLAICTSFWALQWSLQNRPGAETPAKALLAAAATGTLIAFAPIGLRLARESCFDQQYEFFRETVPTLPEKSLIILPHLEEWFTFPMHYTTPDQQVEVRAMRDLTSEDVSSRPVFLLVPILMYAHDSTLRMSVSLTSEGRTLGLAPHRTLTLEYREGTCRCSLTDQDSPFTAERQSVEIGWWRVLALSPSR